ncbi:hypothetical protein [Planococcus sp. YIM B11945]|uniref:hypothetical protein n=1 Tax=Planococcus sp. YIM B11945 TaxID=3435410 RepID=UPI003D7D9568
MISDCFRWQTANKLLADNPNATKLSGQFIRISSAITIFKKGWEKDALKEVIDSKHPTTTNDNKKRAADLMKK